MSTRSRKEEKQYGKYKKKYAHIDGCDFCLVDSTHEQFIQETKSFKVIRNLFPYSSWDEQEVEEHLLIIPKRHIVTIGDFTAHESVEFIDVLASYETKGYNVYMRAPQSTIKTVPHQHAHFIKPTTKTHKFLLTIRKPYIRIAR